MAIKDIAQDIIEKINPKNNKIVLFAIIVLMLIFLLFFVIGLLVNTLGDSGRSIPSPDRRPENGASVFTPTVDNLKIPPGYLRSPEFSWRPFRITEDRWDEEDIERFWQDPADVIIEAYSEENKKYIERILGGVP